ncbi:hypothetical protein ABPG72_018058 [Tetrahymena utriculariae]
MNIDIDAASRECASDMINFINKGVSPYHVVEEGRQRLLKYGFTQLYEADNWSLEKGGKYFYIRSNSTLIAFVVGKNFNASNAGFKVIGAHTDSPALRLAPVSKIDKLNFRQTCVHIYGGALWHTWFDRDLQLAGRVVYKDRDQYKTTLYQSDGPILKVPNLCIHLQSGTELTSFSPNLETNLKPILSSIVYETLTGKAKTEDDVKNAPLKNNHYAGLLLDIQEKTGISVDNIYDVDLCFSDVQPSAFLGLNKEFVSSPRLDNLFSSWACIRAIGDPKYLDQFVNSSNISMINLYDHEECGSVSFQGAASNVLLSAMERIWGVLSQSQSSPLSKDDLQKMFLNSFLLSCDVGHSVHPNYEDRHKENHKIKINEGIALKINPQQRYTTDSVSASLIKACADLVNVPLQAYIVKNDSPCGSTIGPAISSRCGIKAVDIGAPTWGMHSIRETCGIIDTYYLVELMGSFFSNYEKFAPSLLRC